MAILVCVGSNFSEFFNFQSLKIKKSKKFEKNLRIQKTVLGGVGFIKDSHSKL